MIAAKLMVDLSAAPLTYPGPVATRSLLLAPDSDEPLSAALLAELLARSPRVPVAAVGANAAPGVMRWKLADCGAGAGVVPMVRGVLRGVRIAPSAHVSRPGFVPAAPAHDDEAVAPVVVGWLDAEQLGLIDRTEPNYTRVRLAAADYPLEPELGAAPPAVEVYESRWGVLAERGRPMTLGPQAELAARLADLGLTPWATRSPEAAIETLASSSAIREAAKATFSREGLAVPSGLRRSLRS
jgi:hypothetical protein